MTGNLSEYHFVVTGASGFIGKPLVNRLLVSDAKILGIDTKSSSRYENEKNIKNIDNYQFLHTTLESSIKEIKSFLSDVPQKNRIVFHMAGIADAGICNHNPESAYKYNVDLTYQLLEICRSVKGATIIFPSTGLVYGNLLQRPATEDDPVLSASMYTASKISAESIVMAYSYNYYCPSIITRLSNIYGPGASKNTVVGKIINQVENGRTIQVLDPEPVRDFIFLNDVVEALIKLFSIADKKPSTIVNISSGIGHTVGQVVDIANAVTAHTGEIEKQYKINKVFTDYLVLSNNKLNEITGWTPPTSLYDGLKKSIGKRH